MSGILGLWVGPYQLIEKIGEGGMGDVFLAQDPRLQRQVAIKCLKHDASRREKQRLAHEAKLLARLNHANIVGIYDVIEHQDQLYLVMEYVSGRSLDAWLTSKPFSLNQVLALFRQILLAVQSAHMSGVVHRDLKLANILVTDQQHVKVADFGIARALDQSSNPHTKEGWVNGSACAMSPEQALGESVGPASDIFALGLLLYRMLTGHHAFAAEGGNIASVERMLHGSPEPLETYLPDCPDNIKSLVLCLLAKASGKRPANIAAILAMLDQAARDSASHDTKALASDTIPVKQQKLSIPQRLPIKLTTVSMTLLLCLAVISVMYFQSHWRSEPEAVKGLWIAPASISGSMPDQDMFRMLVNQSLLEWGLDRHDFDVVMPEEHQQKLSAESVGAELVLHTELHCNTAHCELNFKLRRVADNRLLRSEHLSLLHDDTLLFRRKLVDAVNLWFGDEEDSKGDNSKVKQSAKATIDHEGYQQYLALIKQYNDQGMNHKLQQQMRALIKRAPFFIPAYVSFNRYCLKAYWDTYNPEQLVLCKSMLQPSENLAEHSPSLQLAFFNLMLASQDLESAKHWLQALKHTNAANSYVLAAEAEWLLATGKEQQALTTLDQAIAVRSTWLSWYKKARFLWQLQELDGALEALRQTLLLSPDNALALRLQATIYSYSGNFEQAAMAYTSLLEKQPDDTALMNDLAVSLIYRQQYTQAIKLLEQAVLLEPDDAYLLLNLADAYLLQQETEKANAIYQQVLSIYQQRDSDIRDEAIKAQVYAHLGRELDAIASVQALQSANPNTAEAAYIAALVYSVLGKPAMAKVNKAQAIMAGVPESWFKLPWFKPAQ